MCISVMSSDLGSDLGSDSSGWDAEDVPGSVLRKMMQCVCVIISCNVVM